MDERYQVSLAGLLDQVDATGVLRLAPDPELLTPAQVGAEVVEAVAPIDVTTGLLVDEERLSALVAELETIKQQLRDLGEVHLGAIDEYRDLEARHGTLETQRVDLAEAVDGIRAGIAKMNRTCREQFRDAFDRVNDAFQETYPRLMGGGRARLALTDEEDLLEAGVDLFVQPPGKRLVNLALLSGGEKAMAGLALILALFRVKPAPFCVLDEVDAPLDEANGARFNAMLSEMAASSQVVVVTHNRHTMECAEVLYGVTMPTPGVSRLVAVRGADLASARGAH